MALTSTIGGALSDTYVTLAEYQAYGGSMGWTLGSGDAADEINLRRAATVLDRKYTFVGYPAESTQALQWPRDNVGYVKGYDVSSTVIPDDIKNAQMEIAYLIQGGLDPFASIEQGIGEAEDRRRVRAVGGENRISDQGEMSPIHQGHSVE